MDFDKLSKKERYDALADMADMFYNQGKTQLEIADYFETTRFKVAKLLQDARNEQIVEIKVNFSNERNKSMEQELIDKYHLQKAIVVNTQYTPYIDSLKQVGQVGAAYLSQLLVSGSVIGIAWGKTIHTVISQLPQIAHNPVSSVQLTGHISLPNSSSESRELVRFVASNYFGEAHYFNTPLYIQDPALNDRLVKEPDIAKTLALAKHMSITLTGIGGRSSLPITNPIFRSYLTEKDLESAESCIGSIYGYVINQDGHIADIDLNQKLSAVPLSDILAVQHRIAVVYGRHKANITAKVIEHQYINELITDTETAVTLLESNY